MVAPPVIRRVTGALVGLGIPITGLLCDVVISRDVRAVAAFRRFCALPAQVLRAFRRDGCRCPVCVSPLGNARVLCPRCATPQHPECRVYRGPCASYGRVPLRTLRPGLDRADTF